MKNNLPQKNVITDLKHVWCQVENGPIAALVYVAVNEKCTKNSNHGTITFE